MKISKTSSLVLLAAIAALSGSVAHAQRSLTLGSPIVEDFSTYAGNATAPGNLPSGFTVDVVAPGAIYQGISDGSGATLNSGLYSFENAGGGSFGILEGDQGTGDIGDTRLFLYFQNNTGATLSRVRVSYKVQLWRDGARLNRIRLKYNTTTSGFSSIADLVNTPAPSNVGGDVARDGNDPTYYTPVTVDVNLPAALANGASAYFRWQYSSSGDSGRRDGLGIADISVSAIPAGTDKNWVGGTGTWNATGGSQWSGGAWSNTGNYNAVFGGTAGTVTLGAPITAVDLKFNTTGYSITGSSALTLTGRIDTAASVTATVDAPVAGTSGLLKTGPGTLELSEANTFTGGISVDAGAIKLLSGGSVNSANTLGLGDNADFDLNVVDVTVNGVQGDALGEVKVPSGRTLTLNTTGAGVASYKGDISGAGAVVKTGTGRQRFRNTEKSYTGPTTVSNGVLEVTENGVPSSTSSVTVTGGAELLLNTDDVLPTYLFGGDITLDNGKLAGDTDDQLVLANNVVIVGATGNGIYARSEDGLVILDGAISGSGTFGKQGDGILELRAASTGFTGTANINDGTFLIPNGVTFGSGASVNVTATGVRDGAIGGNVVFEDESFAVFQPGEQLSASGSVTINGDVEIITDSLASGTHDLIVASSVTNNGVLTASVGTASVVGGNTIRVVIP